MPARITKRPLHPARVRSAARARPARRRDAESADAEFARSAVVKHSIVIAGHPTSVSLERAFWTALKDIAIGRQCSPNDLIAEIDSGRHHDNLSSAIRLFVLEHYRQAAQRAARSQMTV